MTSKQCNKVNVCRIGGIEALIRAGDGEEIIDRAVCALQHITNRHPEEEMIGNDIKCFSSSRIKSLTKGSLPYPDQALDHRQNVTNIYDLVRASVVFLNYFLTFRTWCTPESIKAGYVGSCRTYEQCWSELQKYTSTMKEVNAAENLETVENVLRAVKPSYEPDSSQACFSAEKILNEVDERSENFKNLPHDISTILLIISHLFSGECIDVGESVTDFLDDIFLHYGDGCEKVITESGFTKLWNDLQMQRRDKHINHGVPKSSCGHPITVSYEPVDPVGLENKTKYVHNHVTDEIENSTKKSESTPVPVASIITLMHSNSSTILHGNQKPSEVYRRGNRTPVLDQYKTKNVEDESTSKRIVRHTSLSEEHEHKNLANECLPSNDLLRRFITSENKVITSAEFMQICPALVQQTVSGVCNFRLRSSSVSTFEPTDFSKLNDTNIEYEVTKSNANTWYAVLAVTVITLTSLFSLIMIPTLSRPFFKYVKGFFIGLAFGTMSGDVVLHIMPQYLGLHKHEHGDEHEHGHDHEHDHHSDEESALESLFPSYLQRQLVFLMTMFVLFIAECIFTTLTGQEIEHHGHSHDIDIPMKDFDVTTVENPEGTAKPSCFRRIMESLRPSNFYQGMTSKALVILIADTVHNFADGIAIAAGYSSSYREGFSTTIAVFFHELPHEIGDFVVLMNCGLSYWKAFFFNIISGLSAYIGLGLGVFTAPIFREWLLCITAGLFFFVVMGEMLPDMRLESKKEWKVYVVKLIGSLLGVAAMIFIAMYELADS